MNVKPDNLYYIQYYLLILCTKNGFMFYFSPVYYHQCDFGHNELQRWQARPGEKHPLLPGAKPPD